MLVCYDSCLKFMPSFSALYTHIFFSKKMENRVCAVQHKMPILQVVSFKLLVEPFIQAPSLLNPPPLASCFCGFSYTPPCARGASFFLSLVFYCCLWWHSYFGYFKRGDNRNFGFIRQNILRFGILNVGHICLVVLFLQQQYIATILLPY